MPALKSFTSLTTFALFMNCLVGNLSAATTVVKIGETTGLSPKYFFNPTNITISAGDTIQWTNTVSNSHDSTHNPASGNPLWASPLLSSTTPPRTFSFTFANRGFYPYYCRRHVVLANPTHPEQTGTVSVVAANLPPTVSLIDPQTGAAFLAPASFPIQANASDSDGSVAQVEFFRGQTSLGVINNSPYSNFVSALPAGSYAFTAIATDNKGAKGTSGVVNVTVSALNLSLAQFQGGNFQFRISGGSAGQACIIDACETLPNWAPISTNNFSNTACPACPSIDFTDKSINSAQRFYRCRVTP